MAPYIKKERFTDEDTHLTALKALRAPSLKAKEIILVHSKLDAMIKRLSYLEDLMDSHVRNVSNEVKERHNNKSLHKTKLCRFWHGGYCRYGNSCNFAHGADELRSR